MLKPNFLLTHKIPLTIVRRAAGSYVNGDWVEGSTTNIPIEGNIQPVKPHELLIMPEADRSRSWWKMYTDAALRTQKEGAGGWDADEVTWKNDRYKVMKIDDWTSGMGILEHSKVWLVRIELTPN
ncbi:hypothetical protein D3C85_996090 [compost metagenome]